MRIFKSITTSIDLINSHDIYNPDRETLIKNKLKDRYLNCCYEASLIIDITKIVRMSAIRMSSRIDGGATIDVQFEAECLILTHGELVCCRVLGLHNNGMTAINDSAAIFVQNIKDYAAAYKTIQIGNTIPVTIKRVAYNVGRDKISANAHIYMPELTTNTYYEIMQGLSDEEIEKLQKMVDAIKDLKKTIAAKEKNIVTLFRAFLYPYKKNIEFAESKMKKYELEVKNMAEIDSGIVVYPSETNKDKELFYHSSVVKDIAVQATAYAAFSNILSIYTNYLNSIITLCDNYPNIESIKAINSYWLVCNANKY